MTVPGSALITTSSGSGVGGPSLAAEARTKLNGLGNAWVAAMCELAILRPVVDDGWVDTMLPQASATPFPVAAIAQAYTSASQPANQRANEVTALTTFTNITWERIRTLAFSVPAEAAPLLKEWVKKLISKIVEMTSQAAQLKTGVDTVNLLLNDLTSTTSDPVDAKVKEQLEGAVSKLTALLTEISGGPAPATTGKTGTYAAAKSK